MKAFGITSLCVLLACQIAAARSFEQKNTTESVECANDLIDRVQTNVFDRINEIGAQLEVIIQVFVRCHELPVEESRVCLDDFSQQAIDYVMGVVPDINIAIDEVLLYLLNRLEDYFDCRNDEQAADHRETYCALVLIEYLEMEFSDEFGRVRTLVSDITEGFNSCVIADGVEVRAHCFVDLFTTYGDIFKELMDRVEDGREVFLYRLRPHLDAFYLCRLVDAPTHL